MARKLNNVIRTTSASGESGAPRKLKNVTVSDSTRYGMEKAAENNYKLLQEYQTRRQNNEYITSDELATYRKARTDYSNSTRRLNDMTRAVGGAIDVAKDKQRYDWLDMLGADLDNTEQIMSGFNNAEDYGNAVKEAGYREKYEGKSYADLQKDIVALQHKADTDKSLSDEIAWLKNYSSTDRGVIDAMTLDELDELKKKNAVRKSEMTDRQAYLTKLLTENRRKLERGHTVEGMSMAEIQAEIRKLQNEEKNSDVLYYDNNGTAVTVDGLMAMKQRENELDAIRKDGYTSVAYEELMRRDNFDVDLGELSDFMWYTANGTGGVNAESILKETPEWKKYKALANANGLDLNKSVAEVTEDIKRAERYIEGYKERLEKAGYDWEKHKEYNKYVYDRNLYAAKYAEAEEYGRKHPLDATVTNIIASPFQAVDLVENLGENKTGLVNIYDDDIVNSISARQEGVTEKIDESIDNDVVSWLATTAYSGVTSSLQSAATAAASNFLFGPAAGPAISLGILGSQAAASSFNEAIKNGSTNGQALGTAILAGVAEAAFEKLPLDNLFAAAKGLDTSSVKKLIWSGIKQTGKQTIIEGLEEAGTNIVNTIADAIINGDHSGYNTTVEKLVREGYTREEAQQAAAVEWLKEFAGDIVGGAFGGMASGGSVNLSGVIANYGNARSNGRFTKAMGAMNKADTTAFEDLKSVAGLMPDNTEVQKALKSVDKRDSNAHVGTLARAVNTALSKEFSNAETIEELDGLKEKYGTSNSLVNDYYASEYERIAGETYSAPESAVLQSDARGEQKTTVAETVPLSDATKTELTKRINNRDVIATAKDAAGKEIGVIGFTDNGKLNTTAGAIDPDTVKLDDPTLELLKENAKIYKGAEDLYLSAFAYTPSGVTTAKYEDAFNNIYTAGSLLNMGIEFDNLWAQRGDMLSGTISEDVARIIFDAARNNAVKRRNENSRKKDAERKQNKPKQKKKGKVHIPFDDSTLTERQRVSVETVERIAEAIGAEVYFYASYLDENNVRVYKNAEGKIEKAPNGFYDPKDGSIHLDINAGDTGKSLILYTAAHELTHLIKDMSAVKFDTLADFLMEQYHKKGVDVAELIDEQIEKARENGRTIDYDTAYEEVVASSMETMLADGRLVEKLQQLNEKDKNIVKRIAEYFKELARKIRTVYEKMTPESREGQLVAEMVEVTEQLQELFFDALKDVSVTGASVNEGGSGAEVKMSYNGLRLGLAKNALDKLSDKLGDKFPLSKNFDAVMSNDNTELNIKDVLKNGVIKKNNESFYKAATNAFKASYGGVKTSVHIDQLGIDAMLYQDIAKESINKALGNSDVQNVLDIIPYVTNILRNSILLSVEKLNHTSGKTAGLFGYRLYNLYKYTDGKKISLNCLVCTVVQDIDSAEGYIFRNIENVTIEHGLSNNEVGMPEPSDDDTYTVSQLYRFVKKIKRENGGIKYSNSEKLKYLFSYNRKNNGVLYSYRGEQSDMWHKSDLKVGDTVRYFVDTDDNGNPTYTSLKVTALKSDGFETDAGTFLSYDEEGNMWHKSDLKVGDTVRYFVDTDDNGNPTYTSLKVTALKSDGFETDEGGYIPYDLQNKYWFNENDGKKFSTRASSRSMLASALEPLVQTEEERMLLGEYKDSIDILNETDKKLSRLRRQMDELRYKKGKRTLEDAKAHEELRNEAETLINLVDHHDKKLLELEATKTLKKLVSRERYQAAKEQKAEDKAKEKRARERRNIALRKSQIVRISERFQTKLEANTKAKNIMDPLKGVATTSVTLAKRLFANVQENEDIIKDYNLIHLTAAEKSAVEYYRELLDKREAINSEILVIKKDTTLSEEEKEAKLKAARQSAEKERELISSEISKLNKKLSNLFEREKNARNKREVAPVIDALIKGYKELLESKENHIAGAMASVGEEVIARLEQTKKKLGTVVVSDITYDQIDEVYEAFNMVQHCISTANELFFEGKTEELTKNIQQLQGEVMRYAKPGKDKSVPVAGAEKIVDHYTWQHLNPAYAFERLGSDVGRKLFMELAKADGICAQIEDDSYKFLLGIKKKYGYYNWDLKTANPYLLEDGRSIRLTIEERMAIYALNRRETAGESKTNHLRGDGFKFAPGAKYKRGKGAFGQWVERTEKTDPYQLNENLIDEICGDLTADQKAYADEFINYLSTTLAAHGNKVSYKLYGIELFKEHSYFPIMTVKDFIARQQNVLDGTPTQTSLKNTGMTNRTQENAYNPIVLMGFTQACVEHVAQMARYSAYVLPIENLQRVLNAKPVVEINGEVEVGPVTKSVITRVFGKEATKYFSDYITDLNGGNVGNYTTWYGKLFSRSKKIAVSLSGTVIAQQPAAIARAAAVIDSQYFIPILNSNGQYNIKEVYAEMRKYAPITIKKEIGGYDIGNTRSDVEYMLKGEYTSDAEGFVARIVDGVKNKAKGIVNDKAYRRSVIDTLEMGLAEKADQATWSMIWLAAKKQVAAENSNLEVGSEEYLNKCADLFTKAIVYTQVYDSPNSRSGYMRSKSDTAKFATSFMGEPTTTENMLFDAALKLIRKEKGSGKHFGRVVCAVVASSLLGIALKALPGALRDEDENEGYWDKYAQAFGRYSRDEIIPFNYLPFLRDLWSIAEGLTVERPDMNLISDAVSSCKKLIMLAFDDNKEATPEDVWKAAENALALGGANLRNLRREYNSIRNAIKLGSDGVGSGNLITEYGKGFVGDDTQTNALMIEEFVALVDKEKYEKAKGYISDWVSDKALELAEKDGVSAEDFENEPYYKNKYTEDAKDKLRGLFADAYKEEYLEAVDKKDVKKVKEIRVILYNTWLYSEKGKDGKEINDIDVVFDEWRKSALGNELRDKYKAACGTGDTKTMKQIEKQIKNSGLYKDSEKTLKNWRKDAEKIRDSEQ